MLKCHFTYTLLFTNTYFGKICMRKVVEKLGKDGKNAARRAKTGKRYWSLALSIITIITQAYLGLFWPLGNPSHWRIWEIPPLLCKSAPDLTHTLTTCMRECWIWFRKYKIHSSSQAGLQLQEDWTPQLVDSTKQSCCFDTAVEKEPDVTESMCAASEQPFVGWELVEQRGSATR